MWNRDFWELGGELGIPEKERSGFLLWVERVHEREGVSHAELTQVCRNLKARVGPCHPGRVLHEKGRLLQAVAEVRKVRKPRADTVNDALESFARSILGAKS